MKMLNDLSLAQNRRRLCREEWIFQQDNAAIHNASITKKYLLEQKIRLIDQSACFQSYRKFVGIDCSKVYKGSRQYSAIYELKNLFLHVSEKIPLCQLQKLVENMCS